MKRRRLLLLLVLLAAIAAACGEGEPEPVPSPTALAVALSPASTPAPEPTAALTPEPMATPTPEPTGTPIPVPEPGMLLDRINTAMGLVTTLHITADIVIKTSKEAESELVVIRFEGEGQPGPEGDGRTLTMMHITSEGADLTFTFETRDVDGVSYTQDPFTGEWEIDEEDESSEDDALDAVLAGQLELENMVVEVDSVDGSPMYRVTGSVPDDPEAEQVVLWADVDDLLARTISIEGLVPASDYEGLVPVDLDQLYQSQEYRLSKFNEPVKVVAPTVKAVPTAEPAPLTASQIFAQVSPAVAFIETSAFTGSGVLIQGGYVVTNAHVVWPFEKVRVVFPDGSEFLDASVLAWDLMGDLAVIGPLDTDIAPLELVDGEDLIIGSDLFLVGYPGEAEKFPQPTFSKGLLSRLRQWEAIEMTYFQTDAAVAGGQSGVESQEVV